MLSIFFVILLILFEVIHWKKQNAQQRRVAEQRDTPRELLLPHHYKSFVEVESKLWAATEQGERSKWNTGTIKLRPPEAQIVRDYVQGLRKDFAQANRIYSVIIGRAPNPEILIQAERHRLKIELPYYGLCAVIRLRLRTNRVSLKQLRLLTEFVSTMAYEVRSMLDVLEQEGRTDFVETLLRKS